MRIGVSVGAPFLLSLYTLSRAFIDVYPLTRSDVKQINNPINLIDRKINNNNNNNNNKFLAAHGTNDRPNGTMRQDFIRTSAEHV
jgi:hypothetical protein